MNFNSFVGNKRVKQYLIAALQSHRLPKAFIFYGPEGVGKAGMTILFAKALNCNQFDGEPCNRCNSCFKIDKGIHPDVRLYQPEAKEISIEQIRNLSSQIHLKPFEGRYKVFIIDPAELLSPEAANALLKTLEEPPPNSLIVLITANLSSLLPTIRSRCQLLHFSVIPRRELEETLKKSFNYQASEARILAQLSAGSLGRALSINLAESYEKRKKELLFLKLMASDNCLEAILQRSNELKAKEIINETLETMCSLTRDMLLLSFSKEKELLINIDLEGELKALLKSYKPALLLNILPQIHYTIKAIEENVNFKVAIEALFFYIRDSLEQIEGVNNIN